MMNSLLTWTVQTIREPREIAAGIRAMTLPMPALWLALALVSVLSTLVQYGALLLLGGAQVAPFGLPPVIFAGVLIVGQVVAVYAIAQIGAFMDGKGSFPVMLGLFVWLQFVGFVIQVVAILVTLLAPPLGALFVLVSNLYLVWLLVVFVDVGHDFNNPLKAFGALVLAVLAAAIGLAVVFSLVGVQPIGV